MVRLGQAQIAAGEYEAAKSSIERGAKEMQRLLAPDDALFALSWRQLGVLAARQGDDKTALRHFMAADTRLQSVRHRAKGDYVALLEGLGRLYLKPRNGPAAEEVLRRALTCYVDPGAEDRLARCRHSLACALSLQRRLEEAAALVELWGEHFMAKPDAANHRMVRTELDADFKACENPERAEYWRTLTPPSK